MIGRVSAQEQSYPRTDRWGIQERWIDAADQPQVVADTTLAALREAIGEPPADLEQRAPVVTRPGRDLGLGPIEVRCEDRLGALYRITRAFADLDLDIRLAKISTLGHEIFDAFYVCSSSGQKLTDREHLREVERAVLHQLSLA